MKATLISKENNEVKFKMEISAEEFEKAVIEVYKKEKGKFQIDGFRKGKAPRSIIEKRYGEGIFQEDAVNNIVGAQYPVALDELEIEAIDYPKTEFSQVKKGEGFEVTFTVEVYPEIEVKGYKGVEIEKVSAEVTDEDVDAEIKKMADRNMRMVDVDRPAQLGDSVILDYAGFVGDEQFEGGTAERQLLELGSGQFIPGFEDQLVGAVKEEERDVTVTFPEEYHSEALAGKEAVFKCKVHEIKEKDIPEIDDEFAKDVSEFDTLEELKASKKEDLQKAAEAKAESDMRNAAIDKAVEANEFDIPDALVEQEIDSMINEFAQQLQAQGMNINQFVEFTGQDMGTFREQLKEDALKRLKTKMVVRRITEIEDFEVTEEDIDKEVQAMADMYGMEADKIKELLGASYMDMLKEDLKTRKAMDMIYAEAVIK